MRILSLLPSATETVAALGRAADLVGRSEECDYPASVRSLPVVMRARTLDRDASSKEIDARVRRMVATGESLYTLDLELLQRLAPDLILTQDLCRVCSVTDDEVRNACRSAGIEPRLLSLSPTRLDEVAEGIERIGVELGVGGAAARLAGPLRENGNPPPPRDAPRVAVLEWVDPPILSGLWTPDMVERAGAAYVGPRAGTRAHTTDWAGLRESRPDLVIVAPCSFDLARTRREVAEPTVRSGLDGLDPSYGVWLADEAYFSRPGPRLSHGIALVRSLAAARTPSTPMPFAAWTGGAVA